MIMTVLSESTKARLSIDHAFLVVVDQTIRGVPGPKNRVPLTGPTLYILHNEQIGKYRIEVA